MSARPKSDENNIRIALTISQEMYEELKIIARKKGLNASSLIRLAVAEYIEGQNIK